MAKPPSLVLSLVDEKQDFDPCATASDVPTNDELVVQQVEPVCLEDANSHHHDLSTLRLLIAHIGYVNFYLSHPHLMA
jgi:hypothetical protein